MGVLITTIYILVFLALSYWINKKYLSGISPMSLPVLLLFKIGYAAFFYYVYTFHYGGGELTADAGRFFYEGKVLHDVFRESPSAFFQFLFGTNNDIDFINMYLEKTNHWNGMRYLYINDSRNVLRFNALIYFISTGQVFVHFVIFSFAAFLGSIDLFQWLKTKTNIPPLYLLIVLTMAPSIAFWSSSIIKEPFMILGVCLFFRGLFDESLAMKHKAWRIALGIFLTLSFKTYVALAFIPVILFWWITKWFKNNGYAFVFFSVLGIGGLWLTGQHQTIATKVSNMQEDFFNVTNGGLYVQADSTHFYYVEFDNVKHFKLKNKKAKLMEPVDAFIMQKDERYERFPIHLDEIHKEYEVYLNMSKAGSIVHVTPIRRDFGRLLLNIPEAIYNSFCQPIPNRNSTWLQYPAFIENILYLLGILLAFIFFPKKLTERKKRISSSLLLYTLLLALIVGWVTPVSGAIVRYFIPGQLALLIVLILRIDYTKMMQRIGKAK